MQTPDVRNAAHQAVLLPVGPPNSFGRPFPLPNTYQLGTKADFAYFDPGTSYCLTDLEIWIRTVGHVGVAVPHPIAIASYSVVNGIAG